MLVTGGLFVNKKVILRNTYLLRRTLVLSLCEAHVNISRESARVESINREEKFREVCVGERKILFTFSVTTVALCREAVGNKYAS